MEGWGKGAYGLSTWGLGGESTLALSAAYAVTERLVRVELTLAPLAGLPGRPGDALNPRSWLVILPDGTHLTVLAVAQVDTRTFDISVLEAFLPYPNQLTVTADGLLSPVGDLVGEPSSLPFFGLLWARPRVRTAQQDYRNPSFDSVDQVGGTWSTNTGGDYDLHEGIELLRKLIFRRLTTMRGGFFHLPDYGLGLAVKEPLTSSDLTKLRAEIERQILREPEIEVARARLALTADGILTVSIKAVLSRTQQEVEVDVAVPTSLGGS